MAKSALKTVRVTGMSADTDINEFLNFATRLNLGGSAKGIKLMLQPSRPPHFQPKTTFATQEGEQIGTVTFWSESEKKKALKDQSVSCHLDDDFHGVTVLSSPVEPDLEICALHGLNGNAIQTWTSKENEVMWLRDLLPTTKPFDRARIMTFGYSSQLRDRANESGINEWVHHFLESVSRVRRSAKERQRPILFICHSMGGIVARQAMVRLDQYYDRQEYQGIPPNRCGLLFLSTPHSGSAGADWLNYLHLIEDLWGVRSDVIDILTSFNPQMPEGQENFANVKCKPPFDAFFETESTPLGAFRKQIVTRQSASLDGVIAQPLPGTNHNTICKYAAKFGNFGAVAEKLRELKRRVESGGTYSYTPSDRVLAPPNALNIHNSPGTRFFTGKGLKKCNNFMGREFELKYLVSKAIECNRKGDTTSVSISGIGGMGKTATLLEFAHQQRNERDIFFIHAKEGNSASLHNAYYDIARDVGPEYLLKDYIGQDLYGIWSNESQEDKVERVKKWLGSLEKDQALLLLDDFDGLQSKELRESALPGDAKNILLTTRDPIFRSAAYGEISQLPILKMPLDDVVSIMESVRDSEMNEWNSGGDLHSTHTLRSIAVAVHGHPLAATIAIKFITRVVSRDDEKTAGQAFLEILEGSDFEGRRQFLEFSNDATPSILDNFIVSRTRLSDPKGSAWRLMEFLSMLETDDPQVNYRDFFQSNKFDIDPFEYPDHDVLKKEKTQLSGLLNEIESVSFGERPQRSGPSFFHPLWLECTRHIMEAEGRVRVITQVLKRCSKVLGEAANSDEGAQDTFRKFVPHLRHSLRICKSFKIRASDLNLSPRIVTFIESGDRKLVSIDSAIKAFRSLS